MGEIINVIEQVINSKDFGAVIMGLLFIVIGILIIVFKPHWILTGGQYFNEREEDYALIFLGFFFGFFGGMMSLGVFVCRYFDISLTNIGISVFLIPLFLAVLCLLVIVMVRNYREKNKENTVKF